MTNLHGVVLGARKLTDRITEFEIGQVSGASLPAYQAGAHVDVRIGEDETRSYSLIDFGAEGRAHTSYRIAVQLEPDGQGGSAFMHGLAKGSTLAFSDPKNDFQVDAAQPAVLLAGGIGVTPLISMAARLRDAGQSFAFHYTGRQRGVMAYVEDLNRLCGDALHLHCDDDPATALNLAQIAASLGPAQFYICGPRGMIDAAREAALAAGVAADQIHVELFDAAAPQSDDSAFEVEVASTGEVFTVAPGQSIIEALEDGGMDVMYDCQRGDCGICQCDVISGTPDHRDVVLSDDERASGKVMQICVSRSKSPRLVLDL